MTKKDLTDKRYSLQEMVMYALLVFVAGGFTGGTIRGGSSAQLARIERKVERLEVCVGDLKEKLQAIRIKDEIKKK